MLKNKSERQQNNAMGFAADSKAQVIFSRDKS